MYQSPAGCLPVMAILAKDTMQSIRSNIVKATQILRNGVAAALIAVLPVSTSVAATRPNAAVPAAGSTAVAAQDDYNGTGVAWPALAVIALTLAVALWIILDDDEEGEGDLSPG